MVKSIRICALVLGFIVAFVMTASGQGVIAPGAGPINRSMAGASTAAAFDFGSSYWNPATISFLEREEALIGTELIIPSMHYSSQLRAGSIAGVFPSTNRYGTSRSDSGVPTNLATGASFKLNPDSPLTMGILISGLVGGNVNFAGSTTAPTLGPRQPPNFFGVGPVYANLALLSIKPMASYLVSDKLSIAFAPVITTGTAQFNPAFFAPGPKDQFGVPTFPVATNSRPFWGGGFELGTMYEFDENWNFGFSYKSPVWQEKWVYNSYTPDYTARTIGLQADMPAIYSLGAAYKGVDRLVIDVDVRYFDYANAPLWGDLPVSGGLGWKSIMAVAAGGQYQLTDRLTLRGGYLFNQNPIHEINTVFNVQAPGFIQHTLSLGASLRMSDNILFTVGWVHGFRNTIEGPIGQIPGSSARMDAQTDSILAGLTIQYGGRKSSRIAAVEADSARPAAE